MPGAEKSKLNTFGKRLAQARRELGCREQRDVSPSDLAELLKVSATTVYRWEADEKRPREETMEPLAVVLGVTPGWLRYGQEPKMPSTPPISVEPYYGERETPKKKPAQKRGRSA